MYQPAKVKNFGEKNAIHIFWKVFFKVSQYKVKIPMGVWKNSNNPKISLLKEYHINKTCNKMFEPNKSSQLIYFLTNTYSCKMKIGLTFKSVSLVQFQRK